MRRLFLITSLLEPTQTTLLQRVPLSLPALLALMVNSKLPLIILGLDSGLGQTWTVTVKKDLKSHRKFHSKKLLTSRFVTSTGPFPFKIGSNQPGRGTKAFTGKK